MEQPYIEQAARDKARAEEEKANYDVGFLPFTVTPVLMR